MVNETATRTIRLTHHDGLHLRVCSAIAKAAEKYRAKVTIRKGSQVVDATNVFELLLLAASHGTELVVSARGSEAKEALEAVADLLAVEPAMAFAG